MFGIDPDIAIRDEDRNDVQEMLAEEDSRGRAQVEFRPPAWMHVLAFLPMMVVFLAGLVTVMYVGWPLWSMTCFFVGAVACQVGGIKWIARRHYGLLVRRELRSRGYDICVQCGYWLRGLGEGVKRCPECGAASERTSS